MEYQPHYNNHASIWHSFCSECFCRSPSDYLQGTESLDTAVAKVSEQDKIKHAINTAEKFREQLKDKEFIIKLMDDNDDFKFEMQKIITRLGKLFTEQ